VEFSSEADINASIDAVFAVLSDVDALELQATRGGVEVRRTTPHHVAQAGMGWHVRFRFRGRKRASDIVLAEMSVPTRLVFDSSTGGLETRFRVDLEALSKNQTRVTTYAHMVPKTLSARLLVQSMKLAKSTISRKYTVRMAQFARDVEERALRLS